MAVALNQVSWVGRDTSIQFAHPDVAVAHRIAVVLEQQWSRGGSPGELGGHRRIALDRDVVLDQHPIVEHREGTGDHLAVRTRLGRVEDDVVGLVISRQLRKVSGWMTSTWHQR